MSDMSVYLPPWQYLPFRDSLQGQLRAAYDQILDSVLSYAEGVWVPASIPPATLVEMMQALGDEVPETDYFKNVIPTGEIREGKRYCALEYRLEPEMAAKVAVAMRECTHPVLKRARGLSRPAAIRLFHDWLASRYEYFDGDDVEVPHAHVAAGPVLFGSSVCEGVAKAMKYLCDRAHIPCLVSVGRAGKGSVGKSDGECKALHAWNIIDFAESGRAPCWQHVDATWDSVEKGVRPRLSYFGLSDAAIARDHALGRQPHYPTCPTSIYQRAGLYARDARDLRRIVEDALPRGRNSITFQTMPARNMGDDAAQESLSRNMGRVVLDELQRIGHPASRYVVSPCYSSMVFTVQWE